MGKSPTKCLFFSGLLGNFDVARQGSTSASHTNAGLSGCLMGEIQHKGPKIDSLGVEQDLLVLFYIATKYASSLSGYSISIE